MKRKIFSKLLMGAFLIASVSMFVSCKDYDDDISANKKAIESAQTDLNSKITALQSALDAAKSDFNTKLADYATKAALATTDANVATNKQAIADAQAAAKTAQDALQAAIDANKAAAEAGDAAALAAIEEAKAAAAAAAAKAEELSTANAQEIAKTNEAVEALKQALTAYATVEQLNAAVQAAQATLQTEISGKASKEDLAALEAALNAQIATINANLPELVAPFAKSTDVKDWIAAAVKNLADQEYVNKAISAALDPYAKAEDVNKALEALQKSLNAYAKADDLKNYLSTEAFDTFKASLNDVARKSDIKDWVTTDALEARGYASASDLSTLAGKFETLAKNISTLNDPAKVAVMVEQVGKISGIADDIATIKGDVAKAQTAEQVQNLIKEANKTIEANIKNLNILSVGLSKRLTSLVLKPEFYWEGIEAIEVPYILQTPVFAEKKADYKFSYKLTTDPAGDKVVDVVVKNYMGWLQTDKAINNRELAKYVVATAPAHHSLLPLTAAEQKLVVKTDIAYGGVAEYHLNPSKADINNATITFYDRLADTYTRSLTGLNIAPKDGKYTAESEYNKIVDGNILQVPFTVNYKWLHDTFVAWANTGSTAIDPAWDTDKDGSYGSKANKSYQLPYISLEVSVPAVNGADGKEATPAQDVNSDYALVVPAEYEIVALADKAPETDLDQETFLWKKGDKWVNPHEIRKNHLYETVGYNDSGIQAEDANKANKKFNDAKAYGAIPMPATHSVLYNGEIDLMDYVETHANYTTYTKYGMSTTDQTMDPALLAKLGLSYKFTIVDYMIGTEKTSESAHIQQHDGKATGSKFIPRSVTEKGETIKDKTATREVIDREPLIRVDLVTSKGEIIRYGYIKLRIVGEKQIIDDVPVEITLNDMLYMNCGNEAKITWSQVENLILAKLGKEGYTKQEFEQDYKLDVYGDYSFMPYIDPSKITGDTDPAGPLYTHKWMAKRYFKNAKGAYEPAIDGDKVECDDDSVVVYNAKGVNVGWSNTNNHFGEVWYTPHDNSTEGHNWDEQTNVLIWNLYPGNGTDFKASRTTSTTTVTKEQAGNMNKAKYAALRDAVGIDYDNHQSTKELSTVVRFINKKTGASVWVTLIIPKTKIEFNWGEIANKDWSHWWKMNTQNFGVEQDKAPYWDEFDTHMNTPVPAYKGYKWLEVTDFKQDLRDYWHAPEEMVKMNGAKANYSKFYAPAPGAPVDIDFIFVTPKDKLNSDGVSAAADGTWVVVGASGTKWTLKIAAGNKKIQAVKKNGVAYGPEDVCELIANPEDGETTVLYYRGVEDAANLYPAATDLVNKSGRYDETGAKRFGAGTAMGEQADPAYLMKNIDETFTAYIKVNVTHFCYDPLISKQYFNVRVLRPINVAGKEKKIKDIPNVMQKISLRDLVDIVDYRDIPVVGRYAGAQAAANNAFGIAAPKWDDVSAGVMSGTGTVKVQNAGVPYEFYQVQDLAVMYSEILSDHQAPYAFRNAGALRKAADIEAALKAGNVKAVKDIPSLRGGLEGKDYKVATNPRVLSLWSNDADHSLKVENTWATAQLVDMTQVNTHSKGIGKIEYTNNSGITQLFHIYVPIAVKYNWGNIKLDNTFGKPAKLDNNYTQKVWAVITVDPSYLGE